MKRSLRGSRQQPLPDMNNLNPAMLNDVQSVVDKYGGKSEQELIGELAAAKRSGIIDPNELASVAGKIAPMLTAEQKQRLESVLKQLGQ